MKIGNRTALYEIDGVVDYEKMKAHGYDCADYSALCDTTGFLYTAEKEEFEKYLFAERKRANDAGITFSQVHGPWPVDDTTEEKRAQNLEFMKTAVRGTAALGCENLVVHPVMPYSWSKELDADFAERINEEYFRELCEYAKNYGVYICLENMPKSHRLAPVANIVGFVKRLDIENFAICLDTGHCNTTEEDCGEAVRMCGKLLRVLHVHDNDGCYDQHLFPYTSKIDWNSFIRALKETGFSGCLSIESNCYFPKEINDYMLLGLAKIARNMADKAE